MSKDNTLLQVRGLSVDFCTESGAVRVVDGMSFSVQRGKTFALVGESGCGKTATALAIMRLIPATKIVSSDIVFDGKSLLGLSDKQMRALRGNRIAMIFQEPATSLNPVYTIGDQVAEAIKVHQKKSSHQAKAEAVEMLRKAGISDPKRCANQYPHQMSGGMLQRAMIAMAISGEPELLIADEPTSALDVMVQGQILDLLGEIQERSGMSILLITHDMAVAARLADEIGVMYASRLVEVASVDSVLSRPVHPYTQGLLKCVPRLGQAAKRLQTIPGVVPGPLNFPAGCKFHPRCAIGYEDGRCQTVEPTMREVSSERRAACWYALDYQAGKNARI